jgi:peptide-methionine (S)-S-oxide reductase
MQISNEIILGGGCFWCTEAVYQPLNGIQKVTSGYTGGASKNPTYREICTGASGHAEVIKIDFDPKIISFREILDIFFTVHDPTTLDRQGADRGTQYRSVVYYQNESEKSTIESAKMNAQKDWNAPIITEISQLGAFYKAEDYHQNYYQNHPNEGYCAFVISPKMSKLRKQWAEKLK